MKIGLKGRILKENDDQNLCKKKGKEKTTRVKLGVRAEEMPVIMGNHNRREKHGGLGRVCRLIEGSVKAESLAAKKGENVWGFPVGQVPEGSAMFDTLVHPK